MFFVKTRLAPSSLHGLGVFTVEPIPQGALIWKLDPVFDVVFPLSELERLPPAIANHILHFSYIELNGQTGVLSADNSQYMNHSDTPNVVEVIDADGNSVDVAARDIQAGEELTCDYYQFDADARRKLTDPNA